MIKQRRLKIVHLSCAQLFLSLGLLTASPAKAQSAPAETLTAESVEARLKEKIVGRLDLFLKADEYRLFATAKVNNVREKIVLEGELESKSSGQEVESTKPQALPGFQQVETREDPGKDVDRKERSKFTFRTRSEVANVSVRLILDQALEQPVKDLAVNTTKETIALTVGDVASFELVELDLTQKDAGTVPKSVWQWFTSYINDRGGSAIDLLYLSLLLLGFLGALFALRIYFRDKKKADSTVDVRGDTANHAEDQRQIEEYCNRKLDEIIEQLSAAPLITRNFLQNLKVADKVAIYKALRTPALQSYFRKVLGLTQLSADSVSKEDPKAVFDRVFKDLQRFIRLNNEMETKPFGYLPQMTGIQLANFILAEGERLTTLMVMGPYLSEHHIQEITGRLSVHEKAVFIAGLRDEKGLLKRAANGMEIETYKKRLDERLRERYEGLKGESAVDASEAEALEISFLESDRDCVSVIKSLALKQGTMPRTYEKYLVGFEDFLGLDLGIARKVLQKVSNETLRSALANREIDARLITLLGEMRSQLVESLKQRGDAISEKDVEDAQNEVMRLYRSMV